MTRAPGLTVGVHGAGHDVAAAVLAPDGTVLHVAEEERYSRIKGSSRRATVGWLLGVLAEAGAAPEDVAMLATAGVPGLVRRRAEREGRYQEAQPAGWVDELASHLPQVAEVTAVRHHVAHAASAAWCSPFDRCLVVTADGMGETDCVTVSSFEGFRLRPVARAEVPHSIGWVYRQLCNWAGMQGVEREGKFMGLAAHGSPRHVDLLRSAVLSTGVRGLPALDPRLIAAAAAGTERLYLDDLFGPIGRTTENDTPGSVVVPELQVAADVAASAQSLLHEDLTTLVLQHCKSESQDAVAVAGGVFMNSVLNGQLARVLSPGAFFAQPMAGDNGLALGAALASARPQRTGLLRTAYLGSDTGHPPRAALETACPGFVVEAPADLPAAVAALVHEGHPVAVCRGRSEVGARALGHRSIVACATHPDSGAVVNRLLKRREAWRPFALTLLEEATELLFGRALRSPYMMEVHPLARPDLVPAAAHVDGSTRPQTVSPDGDPFLGALLRRVNELAGVPAVLNTSLNGNGEPIVRTWSDAVALLEGSALEAMVVEDFLVRRSA